MVREVSFSHLLRNIGSRFSLFFFGCSLSDQDLLAFLDDIKENLGGEIGPHFWLTADTVHPKRRLYLQRHYSIHVVSMPGKCVCKVKISLNPYCAVVFFVRLIDCFFLFLLQAQLWHAVSVLVPSVTLWMVSADPDQRALVPPQGAGWYRSPHSTAAEQRGRACIQHSTQA